MKIKVIFLILIVLQILFINNPARSELAPNSIKQGTCFREVWGYMMRGEENLFTGSEPVTDVFYFSCTVNYKGRLNINVVPPVLASAMGETRRIHIVIADLSNYALMHFALDPDFEVRDKLINDIVAVSEKFDGVQIDFESVAADDGENFLSFLKVLKGKLKPEKVLSIALPAKAKLVTDAYDYKKISSIADRIFIMTYDEHWSTSIPGPVASFTWCREVVNFASDNIPPDKLVMGIPFYGRSWQDKNFNKSVRTGKLDELLLKENILKEYSDETGNKIIYRDTVDITVYCDNNNSIREKLLLFRNYTDSVGFWRLGFENKNIWDEIEIIKNVAGKN
ncbi:MAG TPA: glycosyl hydrolase family 18 protein [Spirochaetota bacterium]|nr:glycosyl hydrolase family 18 protein [Spirochaetota bacterium]